MSGEQALAHRPWSTPDRHGYSAHQTLGAGSAHTSTDTDTDTERGTGAGQAETQAQAHKMYTSTRSGVTTGSPSHMIRPRKLPRAVPAFLHLPKRCRQCGLVSKACTVSSAPYLSPGKAHTGQPPNIPPSPLLPLPSLSLIPPRKPPRAALPPALSRKGAGSAKPRNHALHCQLSSPASALVRPKPGQST